MQTRIVTDSTAELEPKAAEALDVIVVPQRLQVGAETFVDDAQPRSFDLNKRLARSKDTISVVPPSPRDFAEVYARLSGEADSVISLHVSSGLNGTVLAANAARRSILGHCQINVIDSGLISRALGVLVTEAAKAAQAGAEGAEVVRLVRGLISRIYLAFYVESMDHLRRSGFIPQRRVVVEGGVAFKPLFLIEDGSIVKLHRTRSRGTTVERLGEFVAEFTSLKELAILYSSSGPKPEPLETLLNQLLPNQPVIKHQYGSAFSVYVGPQALGVVAFEA
jgi:DegV family protein with EDD domain